MFSVSIITVTCILAQIATVILLKSAVAHRQKQLIFLAMGVLVFLSILISTLKEQEILSFSLLKTPTKDKLTALFTQHISPYPSKYHNIDHEIIGDSLLLRNYGEIGYRDYTQFIVYSSSKNEGASYSMCQLASKLRSNGNPTFYIKIESMHAVNRQFIRKTKLNSFNALFGAVNYYLQRKKQIFLIIDNAERLPETFWEQLSHYESEKNPSVILNTENPGMLMQILSQTPGSDQLIRQIQFQRWLGPDQQLFQLLSPQNSYTRKLHIDFDVISAMKEGASQQEILLKNSNVKNNVALYFGLLEPYKTIKRMSERGVSISLSTIKQSQISIESLQELERLRLISISEGTVKLR